MTRAERTEKKKNEFLEKYRDVLSKMSNEGILDEYSDLCMGDDYDGCYTTEGSWKFIEVTNEFRKRLTTYGYLT